MVLAEGSLPGLQHHADGGGHVHLGVRLVLARDVLEQALMYTRERQGEEEEIGGAGGWWNTRPLAGMNRILRETKHQHPKISQSRASLTQNPPRPHNLNNVSYPESGAHGLVVGGIRHIG